jgi:hypothetical protein
MRLLAFLLCCSVAHAQENHDLYHSEYQHWYNKLGEECCGRRDCGTLEDKDVRIIDGHYYVHLKGTWCVIPEHTFVKRKSPDWSHYHFCRSALYKLVVDPCLMIRCFMPKPLS